MVSAPLRQADHSAEADLYAAIATSWYWSNPRGVGVSENRCQFVLGPDFAACARIVSQHNWELPGMQVTKHAERRSEVDLQRLFGVIVPSTPQTQRPKPTTVRKSGYTPSLGI